MSSFARALEDARYVSFGGCGTKGVSYIGCLRALQRHHATHAAWHQRLRGACGSSSGCIAALAFLVDVDADALLERWRSLRLTTVVPYVDFGAVLAKYGADAGDELRRIIQAALTECGLSRDTTFRALHKLTGRELRLCVTNVNRCRLEVFSHTTHPDVVVADAMYWSMTVPFVFQPESYGGDLMVDGCVLAYVPYDVWPLAESVVFHTNGVNTGDEAHGEVRQEVSDLRSFSGSVMRCCARSILRTTHELSKVHPERFVRISVADERVDTSLTLDDAAFEALVQLGFASVFLRLYPDVAAVFTGLMRVTLELQEPAQHDVTDQL